MGKQSSGNLRIRIGTELSFFIIGFCGSCWAPLIPYAKERLQIDASTMGALFLCGAMGAIISMSFSGSVCAKYTPRPLILAGSIGMAVALPLLSWLSNGFCMGLALLFSGCSGGCLNVAINTNAVDVEHLLEENLMSRFHGLCSIGGFVGAAFMTTILASTSLAPVTAASMASLIVLVLVAVMSPCLSHRQSRNDKTENQSPLFVLPRGIVLVLALMSATSFLLEGAMMDWGALFVSATELLPSHKSGLPYMVFSVSMTIVRLAGDYIVLKLGTFRALISGGILAVLGMLLVLIAPWVWLALCGFSFVGLGMANVFPINVRLSGNQSEMPPGHAIAAVTATGYIGSLLGPAGIGLMARVTSLKGSFELLATLSCIIPLCALALTQSKSLSCSNPMNEQNTYDLDDTPERIIDEE